MGRRRHNFHAAASRRNGTKLDRMLKIQNLSKTYANGVRALVDVSLEIPTGMYGLVGPNGAGKSSLMRTIATLQDPDEGTITLDGIDLVKNKAEARRILGYLPQDFGVYPKVSAEDLLDHLAVLKGVVDRTERRELVRALLRQTNLFEKRKKALGTFSGGMKQRFGIAQALIGSPKLIILDEPTAGLDPSERNRFLNYLSELGRNIVVMLSTHIVEDVADLCPQMAIINQGHVYLDGSPSALIDQLNGKVWRKQIGPHEVDDYRKSHEILSSRLSSGQRVIHVLNEGPPGDGFSAVEPDLHDVYFEALSRAGRPVDGA